MLKLQESASKHPRGIMTITAHADHAETTTPWIGPEPEDEPDLFALLCERRGWTPEFFADLERTDHHELKDMDRILEQLHRAHEEGLEVTIAPDFDMDGICAGVLGHAGLAELGFKVNLQLPDYRRGHDLTPEDIAQIAREYPGTSVLLTCDAGVNSHAGLAAAKEQGWITLVTDHHQELLPGCPADVIVDPCRLDEVYELRGICGAHVLWQVLAAYTARYQPEKTWEIRLLRLFAGLGTVSDLMPVIRENRALLRDSLSLARLLHVPAPLVIPGRYGNLEPDPDRIDIRGASLLQVLAAGEHHPVFLAAFEGVAIALKAFTQAGKLTSAASLDEDFYGFYLAPAMNSPRRTGAPLDDCFAVFAPGDEDARMGAMQRIIGNNELRKRLTTQHLAALQERDQPLAPWIYRSDAPAGMLGLLANTLMHRTGHPVLVLGDEPHDGMHSGSARAPEWFNMITALEIHPGMDAIGHAQACGVRIADSLLEHAASILKITSRMQKILHHQSLGDETAGRIGSLVLGSAPEADAPLIGSEALLDLITRIEALAPFGQGFAEPRFEVVLSAGFSLDRIGQNRQHLRIMTLSGVPCLWWNAAEEHYEELLHVADNAQSEPLRLLVKLQLNHFRDETHLQAIIDQRL